MMFENRCQATKKPNLSGYWMLSVNPIYLLFVFLAQFSTLREHSASVPICTARCTHCSADKVLFSLQQTNWESHMWVSGPAENISVNRVC